MDQMQRVALIADDDDFFRMAAAAILRDQLGLARVIQAASLDEALERMGEVPQTTIALFDLSMPGMESAASLRAVRECFPRSRIAVVSASERRRDILLALEAGVHGYVPKSVGTIELAAALKSILGGAIYVPPAIADLSDEDTNLMAHYGTRCADGERVLTPRQREVLELLVRGKSNKEIARGLNLGEGTVKVHMAALFRVLGVTSRSAAAVAGSKLLPVG